MIGAYSIKYAADFGKIIIHTPSKNYKSINQFDEYIQSSQKIIFGVLW